MPLLLEDNQGEIRISSLCLRLSHRLHDYVSVWNNYVSFHCFSVCISIRLLSCRPAVPFLGACLSVFQSPLFVWSLLFSISSFVWVHAYLIINLIHFTSGRNLHLQHISLYSPVSESQTRRKVEWIWSLQGSVDLQWILLENKDEVLISYTFLGRMSIGWWMDYSHFICNTDVPPNLYKGFFNF